MKKEKKRKEQKQTYLGWYVLTGVIIVFALFAPYVFTRPGKVVFAETGQIGDTIAGTMGPFIAIAGVIVTFLAFLMQKNANDILSKQYDSEKQDEKDRIEGLYKTRIELMRSDVSMAKKDIDSRIDKIEEFKQKLSDNPFRTLRLQRPPKDFYKRMSESNREDLLLALTGLSIKEPSLALKSYYSISDYMSSAVDLLNDMCDGLSNEIHTKLVIIREDIQTIEKIALENNWLGANEIEIVSAFFKSIQEHSKTEVNGESSFRHYWPALESLHKGLNLFAETEADISGYRDPQKDDVIEICKRSENRYQLILNAVAQITQTLDESVAKFEDIAKRCDETQSLITY